MRRTVVLLLCDGCGQETEQVFSFGVGIRDPAMGTANGPSAELCETCATAFVDVVAIYFPAEGVAYLRGQLPSGIAR